MFAEFEKIIHALEENGDALTLDVFKSEYHKLLATYFAENFVLDPQLALECLRIPHFYSGFYVYKYATGISAAVALSERVLAGESGSVDAYLNFLRSGGSKFPLETLKAAGVDMATPAPVESTLRLFEQRLGELEELLLADK
jgi:oligoendopeptidase F